MTLSATKSFCVQQDIVDGSGVSVYDMNKEIKQKSYFPNTIDKH